MKFFFGLLAAMLRILPRRSVEPEIRTILIIRIATLGETLLTFPMVRAVREAYPNARLVVLTSARVLWEANPDVDEIADFSYWGAMRMAVKSARHYDVAIDTEPASLATAVIANLLGKKAVGFDTVGRGFLFDAPVAFDDRQYEAQTFLDLLRPLKVVSAFQALVEPTPGKIAPRTEELIHSLAHDKTLVGINLGASQAASERLWPLGHFSDLICRLGREFVCQFVFFGLKPEKELLARIKPHIGDIDIVDLTDRLNVGELIALIKEMNLFISSDTGTMHLAAAVGRPVFSFFGPNLPVRFAPRNPDSKSFYVQRECSPCINVHLGQLGNKFGCDGECIKDIAVETVVEQIAGYIRCMPKVQK